MNRRPITRPARQGLEQEFLDRTRAMYDSMKQRYQRIMAARLYSREWPDFPFTLEQFRAWMLEALGGTWDHAVQCAYCTTMVNIKTLRPDHKIPVAKPWLGSFDLWNLVLACAPCNTLKGKMSEVGFRNLVTFLTTILGQYDRADVMQRLAAGGEGAKMMWKRQSQR